MSSKSLGNVKKRVDPLTKGGCDEVDYTVAFTPKGGCPLKPSANARPTAPVSACSIHPQGWVPIETTNDEMLVDQMREIVAFTPKGGCPLK